MRFAFESSIGGVCLRMNIGSAHKAALSLISMLPLCSLRAAEMTERDKTLQDTPSCCHLGAQLTPLNHKLQLHRILTAKNDAEYVWIRVEYFTAACFVLIIASQQRAGVMDTHIQNRKWYISLFIFLACHRL